MSTLIKILVITLFINLSLGMFGLTELNSPTQFSLLNTSSIPTDPNSAVGSQTNVDQGSFIDTLRLVFGFLLLMLLTLFLPVYWGVALSLPIWLTWILGIETIVGIVSWILVIRGVGS